LAVLVPPSIDVEAFLEGCDVEDEPVGAPVEEDSAATVSSSLLGAASVIIAFGMM
jgi:hypothetical protein